MKVKLLFLSLLIFFFLSCSKDTETISQATEPPPIPTSTVNYALMENWAFHPTKTGTQLPNYDLDIAVINPNLTINSIVQIPNNSIVNTGVDVFFVHPTLLTGSTTTASLVSINDQPSAVISGTILAQGGLLAKYGRFFAPRYRQSTGPTYSTDTDKTLQASIITASYSDIKAAFLDYLNHYNNGNKIILAGHSQGSYLLAMLLRDVFDQNPALRSKLVTAALGGMGYVYALPNTYQNGWWENIKLCTAMNECAGVHTWMSHKEEDPLPEPNSGFPAFNQNLVTNGLVFRTINLTQDWFIQDDLYYTSQLQPLRNYIVSDANYNLGGIKNYIAFDNMYTVRFRRDAPNKVGLTVAYAPAAGDQRPNDLATLNGSNPNFPNWGYHPKDYNIYLWALMQQIDAKILNCQ